MSGIVGPIGYELETAAIKAKFQQHCPSAEISINYYHTDDGAATEFHAKYASFKVPLKDLHQLATTPAIIKGSKTPYVECKTKQYSVKCCSHCLQKAHSKASCPAREKQAACCHCGSHEHKKSDCNTPLDSRRCLFCGVGAHPTIKCPQFVGKYVDVQLPKAMRPVMVKPVPPARPARQSAPAPDQKRRGSVAAAPAAAAAVAAAPGGEVKGGPSAAEQSAKAFVGTKAAEVRLAALVKAEVEKCVKPLIEKLALQDQRDARIDKLEAMVVQLAASVQALLNAQGVRPIAKKPSPKKSDKVLGGSGAGASPASPALASAASSAASTVPLTMKQQLLASVSPTTVASQPSRVGLRSGSRTGQDQAEPPG
jgi:hypothetical protein